MSFERCRHCKSPVNPERFPRCIGCGAEIKETLPPSKRTKPNVLVQGSKDAGNATRIFSIIGVLGILGFFGAVGMESGFLMVLTGLGALAGIGAWIVRLARVQNPSAAQVLVRVVVILGLCGVALFFGLGILLGFACMMDGKPSFH